MEIYDDYEKVDLFAPNHICYKADAVQCKEHENCSWHIADGVEIHVRQLDRKEAHH